MTESDKISSDGSDSTNSEERGTLEIRSPRNLLLVGILSPLLLLVSVFIAEIVNISDFDILKAIFYTTYLISILSLVVDVRDTGRGGTSLTRRTGYVAIVAHVISIWAFTHAFVLNERLGSLVLVILYGPVWSISTFVPVLYVILRVE